VNIDYQSRETALLRKISGRKNAIRYISLTRLPYLYRLPSTLKAMKYTRIGWAGHVAIKRETINVYKILVRKYL
jgi:uncharacterized metal-binding protein